MTYIHASNSTKSGQARLSFSASSTIRTLADKQ